MANPFHRTLYSLAGTDPDFIEKYCSESVKTKRRFAGWSVLLDGGLTFLFLFFALLTILSETMDNTYIIWGLGFIVSAVISSVVVAADKDLFITTDFTTFFFRTLWVLILAVGTSSIFSMTISEKKLMDFMEYQHNEVYSYEKQYKEDKSFFSKYSAYWQLLTSDYEIFKGSRIAQRVILASSLIFVALPIFCALSVRNDKYAIATHYTSKLDYLIIRLQKSAEKVTVQNQAVLEETRASIQHAYTLLNSPDVSRKRLQDIVESVEATLDKIDLTPTTPIPPTTNNNTSTPNETFDYNEYND